MNRRGFLRTVGLLTAGAIVAPSELLKPAQDVNAAIEAEWLDVTAGLPYFADWCMVPWQTMMARALDQLVGEGAWKWESLDHGTIILTLPGWMRLETMRDLYERVIWQLKPAGVWIELRQFPQGPCGAELIGYHTVQYKKDGEMEHVWNT